ncbi:MAG: signal peptidase I [Candidatus Sungbacteria bacterium RIFCSPLOWO2_01_FULL_47_10]|uniref:Signal peptidase I n=1 Tax=Candidatus Sungbacteria bacterium RIFCSPLOWO2_01_FULL_47_10 TaxID=1802276 RepID=A0A1G2L415_9BACT|nr:MAG: signal peptidase I [Candidatus Sungbacteria bacterium RIFCSPLOWO2_01_FULL_47_10]
MTESNEPKKKEQPAVEQPKKSVGRELWEFAKVVFFALLIAIPIRYFIAQPFIVRGQSMEPSFEDKEYLIIDELTYQFRDPERGEVIVFRFPGDTSEFFIKRIIGLPGEKITVEDGKIRIYDPAQGKEFILDESYLPPSLETGPEKAYALEENKYLVLGDNRRNSSDSRIWGPLDKRFITGRAVFRAWPPSKFGLIPEVSY